MKRRFVASLLLALVLVAGGVAEAATRTPYLVFDPATGKVIAQRDPNQAWYPASLTKLMTVYIAFRELAAGRLTMTSPVKITQNALNEPPSKMGFKVGTILTVDNAIKMLLVKSANDIAVAMGEAISGKEEDFVVRMNEEARRLGMSDTRFVNPNGLPAEGQVTTARDLGILARAIWLEFPQHRDLFRIAAIRHGKTVMRNYNSLLERFPGASGMKTGFICASGFNLVASATRGNETLIAVVLGARSANDRSEQAAQLFNKAFTSWGSGFMALTIDKIAGAGSSVPVDMRPEVCERQAAEAGEEMAEGEGEVVSALGPRVKYMEPIKVFTGGADRQKPDLVEGMLLPRPRPDPATLPKPVAMPDDMPDTLRPAFDDYFE